ncbi:MAG: formimidoylglutamase [Bacteroidia bacterium]
MEKLCAMDNVVQIYSRQEIDQRFRKRSGETKLGECVKLLDTSTNLQEALTNCLSKFVLLGIPEDIGIRANYGRGGAWSAWEPALTNILNLQATTSLNGENLAVLGQIQTADLMQQCDLLDLKTKAGIDQARLLTAELDARVSQTIEAIVLAGKVPIVIGGGHNNAYGNIAGTAKALRQMGKANAINVINCDAHSDFRACEGRHSGNGFRYAWEEGLLNKYALVGLHENYNAQNIRNELQKHPDRIQSSSFDAYIFEQTQTWQDMVAQAVAFTQNEFTGIELDLDCIENIPSSARTPSGISANEARQYVVWASQHTHVAYLHLCEAAPVLAHRNADFKIGKLMAYLVSDFLRYAKN